MSKVSMVGKITCQEGKGDEMETMITAMVAASRDVDGMEIYSYHRGEGDTFWFFALMSSQEAVESHGQSEAMQAAMAGMGDVLAGPPEIAMCTPLPANGLDL